MAARGSPAVEPCSAELLRSRTHRFLIGAHRVRVEARQADTPRARWSDGGLSARSPAVTCSSPDTAIVPVIAVSLAKEKAPGSIARLHLARGCCPSETWRRTLVDSLVYTADGCGAPLPSLAVRGSPSCSISMRTGLGGRPLPSAARYFLGVGWPRGYRPLVPGRPSGSPQEGDHYRARR